MAAPAGPSFLGIGAQKAGTTWLHRMLSLHADIGMPEQKELHFWDRETLDETAITAYLGRFASLRGLARGEITPAYAVLPPERIALIKQHLPELRLIYILRNPMERAWSQARMEYARHVEQQASEPADLRAWLSTQLRSSGSMARGDYATCLRNWRAVYPGQQLAVFLYEEAFAAPRRFLGACTAHLGVDPGFYSGVPDATLEAEIYPEDSILKVQRRELPGSLAVEFAPLLRELYVQRIQELAGLLGRDLTGIWPVT